MNPHLGRGRRIHLSKLVDDCEKAFINKVLCGKNPYELTQEAVEAGDLDKLILGVEPYVYFDKYAPGNGPTDVLSIYEYGICAYAHMHPEYDMKGKIEILVPQLCRTSVGRKAVETIIFSEDYGKANNQTRIILGLDLGSIRALCDQPPISPKRSSISECEDDAQMRLF